MSVIYVVMTDTGDGDDPRAVGAYHCLVNAERRAKQEALPCVRVEVLSVPVLDAVSGIAGLTV